MWKGRVYGIAYLLLLLLSFVACGETNENPKEDKATPSIAPTITKTPEEKEISTLLDGVAALLGIPTSQIILRCRDMAVDRLGKRYILCLSVRTGCGKYAGA